MTRIEEIFVPSAIPTFTYVEREDEGTALRVKQALNTTNQIVSLSGPSKSGKTVLVSKVVGPENLIKVSGSHTLRTPDELWAAVLFETGEPTGRSVIEKTSTSAEESAEGGAELNVPLILKLGTKLNGKTKTEQGFENVRTYPTAGLSQIIHSLASSSRVVFIDDFHYINRDLQKEIAQQIKGAAERGVRFCTASVPHRSDDVVRSNAELRGRVSIINIEPWQRDDLTKIIDKGFIALNATIEPILKAGILDEAFGSPHLVQATCLALCRQFRIEHDQPTRQNLSYDITRLIKAYQEVSDMMDFSRVIDALHGGPKQRGIARKKYNFRDKSPSGDVYRCILLALKAKRELTVTYDQIRRRVQNICIGEAPSGSSINRALAKMQETFEALEPENRVMDWEHHQLHITDPYFLFFLRNSAILSRLGSASRSDDGIENDGEMALWPTGPS